MLVRLIVELLTLLLPRLEHCYFAIVTVRPVPSRDLGSSSTLVTIVAITTTPKHSPPQPHHILNSTITIAATVAARVQPVVRNARLSSSS